MHIYATESYFQSDFEKINRPDSAGDAADQQQYRPGRQAQP